MLLCFFILFGLFSFLSILNIFTKFKSKLLLFFLFGFLVVLLHSLNYQFVVDAPGYVELFNTAVEGGGNIWLYGYEPGYVCFNFLVSCLGQTPYSIFLYGYILFLLVYYLSVKDESPYPFLSFLFLFSSFYLLVPLRQTIASALFVYSFRFIREGKIIYYLIASVIAISFHWSALLMIPAYFFARHSFKKYSTYFILFLIAIAVGRFLPFDSIASLFGKSSYIGAEAIGLTLGMAYHCFVLIVSFYILRKGEADNKYRIIFNIYYWSVLIYFSFNSYPIIATRGSEFLSVYRVLLFPYWFLYSDNKMNKLIIFAILILFFAYGLKGKLDMVDFFYVHENNSIFK